MPRSAVVIVFVLMQEKSKPGKRLVVEPVLPTCGCSLYYTERCWKGVSDYDCSAWFSDTWRATSLSLRSS